LRLRDAEAAQRRHADRAKGVALRLRDSALAETYRATLSETRAIRLTHQPGWRYQALTNLRKLATMKVPRRDRAELRAEAIAALLDLDAREALRLAGHEGLVWALHFSPDSRSLVTADQQGSVRLWDVAQGKARREITDGVVGHPQRRLLHPFGHPGAR